MGGAPPLDPTVKEIYDIVSHRRLRDIQTYRDELKSNPSMVRDRAVCLMSSVALWCMTKGGGGGNPAPHFTMQTLLNGLFLWKRKETHKVLI